jgi:hypothetical protein
MAATAQLVWYAPSWMRDAMATDVVNDHANGVNMLTNAYAFIDDAIADRNITPVWYRDLRGGGGNNPASPQGVGALVDWTDDAVTWLHAPGTFVKLDGGSLDVGLVRDSELNATNDLELFMEEWLGMAMVGCESVQLTITGCPSGVAPTAAAAGTCATL